MSQTLFVTLLLTGAGVTLGSPLLLPLYSRADDAADTTSNDQELPPIDATTFPVTIERRSLSGHVYLLSTPGEIPDVGRLILLKKDSTPVMAFRVLKRYQGKNQFAGKWMRRYNDVKQLEATQNYTAVQKVSDRTPETPLTNQDKKDLSEIEKPAAPPVPEVPPPEAVAPPPTAEAAPAAEASPAAGDKQAAIADNTIPPAPEAVPSTPPENLPPPEAPLPAPEAAAPPAPAPSPDSFDSELDAGTSPPPKGAPEVATESAEAKEPETGDDLSSVMVEEKRLPQHDSNFISAGVGVYMNYNNGSGTGGVSFYTPGGFIGYSHILKQSVFLKGGKGPADDLAVEGSAGYYKILTLVNSGDSYTVVPLKGDLRYTVMISDDFGIFGYGGLEQNVVAATVAPTQTAQQSLNSLVPAVGLGLLFRAGPSWYVRLDGGYDGAGLSLALRF
jgi:hypothetical protein